MGVSCVVLKQNYTVHVLYIYDLLLKCLASAIFKHEVYNNPFNKTECIIREWCKLKTIKVYSRACSQTNYCSFDAIDDKNWNFKKINKQQTVTKFVAITAF